MRCESSTSGARSKGLSDADRGVEELDFAPSKSTCCARRVSRGVNGSIRGSLWIQADMTAPFTER